MYQFSSRSTYVLLSVYVILNAVDSERLSYQADDGYDIKRYVTGTGLSRSVPGIADAVVKAFMKGAREVPTKSTVYRKFLKQGTGFDAIAEFNSLNADNVSRNGYGAIGVTGDTRVKLTLRDREISGLPTVQIWDPNMAKSVKIVYINKPI